MSTAPTASVPGRPAPASPGSRFKQGLVAGLMSVLMAWTSPAWPGDEAAAPKLVDMATRYAAAWSSQDPAALAAFYEVNGVLVVNDGEPAAGREAVAARAAGFMEAFPDMVVSLVEVTGSGQQAVFHWHWTGTNTGPGGTGRAVDLRGYEEWTLGDNGLILESRGHYDKDDYQRQLSDDAIFQ